MSDRTSRAQKASFPVPSRPILDDIELPAINDPLGREVVVYYGCPNEASAATAARRLKHAGFKRIRPLLGGIDAWVSDGGPIELPRSNANELSGRWGGHSCRFAVSSRAGVSKLDGSVGNTVASGDQERAKDYEDKRDHGLAAGSRQ
jgi:hypothetical protein